MCLLMVGSKIFLSKGPSQFPKRRRGFATLN